MSAIGRGTSGMDDGASQPLAQLRNPADSAPPPPASVAPRRIDTATGLGVAKPPASQIPPAYDPTPDQTARSLIAPEPMPSSVSLNGLYRAIELLNSGKLPQVAVAELLRQEARAVQRAIQTLEDQKRSQMSTSSEGHLAPMAEREHSVSHCSERILELTRERDTALARVRELSRELAAEQMARAAPSQPPPSQGTVLSSSPPSSQSIPPSVRSTPTASNPSRYPVPGLRARTDTQTHLPTTYSVGPGRIAAEEVFTPPTPSRRPPR